jgi:ribosomal protein S18 acetylase RimI-like enzyme
MVNYEAHDGAAARDHEDAVWSLYDRVFADFADQATWHDAMWERHRTRDGFRLVTAYDAESLIGFGWCYLGERGQYWPDLVVDRLPREVTDEWVGGHLEVVELAVAPHARRAGVGRRLHDQMVAGRGDRRGLLGTSADESDPAVRLYRDCGWVTLGLLADDVQVMGLAGPGPALV